MECESYARLEETLPSIKAKNKKQFLKRKLKDALLSHVENYASKKFNKLRKTNVRDIKDHIRPELEYEIK